MKLRRQKSSSLEQDMKEKAAVHRFDRLLTGGLMMVAAAAAGLPWYVFLNPEKFGISGVGWEALRNLPQRNGGGAIAVVPHVEDGLTSEGRKEPVNVEIDNVITATVPTMGQGRNEEEGKSQPFPGGTRFKLLHVSNGRALIEDKSGMFLVQVGSVLPDESRLLSLVNVDGKWQIVTSSGESYSE